MPERLFYNLTWGEFRATAVPRLRELLAASVPYREICAEFSCAKSTLSYYAAQIGLAKSNRRHDWSAIRAFYEAGNSGHATRREFGVNDKSWQDAVKRGAIVPRPRRCWVRTIAEILAAPSVCRTHLRRRLVREGLLLPRCAFCGIDRWRDLPLSLELDHINGNKRDNRLENLRLLCPNCHSQTETHSERNLKRALQQKHLRAERSFT